MVCSKKYGPGKLLVAQETTFGEFVALSAGQATVGTAFTMPALYREALDNNAFRTDRFTNDPFDGQQAELAWECTIPMPDGMPTSGPIADLFWAAGFNPTNGTLEVGPICKRSLQIARQDRDGWLIEILNGCLVSQVVYNFSVTEQPTVVFSGVASCKTELCSRSDFTIELASAADSYTMNPENFPGMIRNSVQLAYPATTITFPAGISAIFKNPSETMNATIDTAIVSNSITFEFTELTEAKNFNAILFQLPGTPTQSNTVSTNTWETHYCTIGGYDYKTVPLQNLTLTIETGVGFGELTNVNAALPSEVISAQCKITGSGTSYLDEQFEEFMAADRQFVIQMYRNGTAKKWIEMSHISFTERPAYDLAVDAAASGEISFSVYGNSPLEFHADD